MKIKSLSKQEARKYKPTGKSLMISIQDYEKKYLPFKERTILPVVCIKTLCSYISTILIMKIYEMVCQVLQHSRTKMRFTSSDF